MTRRYLLTVIGSLMLAACGRESAPDFCSDHVLFHAEHADSNALLGVTMKVDGHLESNIRLPAAEFDVVATMRLLQDVNNVYSLQTETECAAVDTTVSDNEGSVLAVYVSDCGADNKLGQIDVRMFDTMPGLEEVEVFVKTPVTEKHFLINRQCATAIFRFE